MLLSTNYIAFLQTLQEKCLYLRHTYEVAPVFVLMEKYMMKKLTTLMGFENGDGVLCPGIVQFNLCSYFQFSFEL